MRKSSRSPVRKAADSSKPERRLARAINQGWDILDAGAMTAHAQAQVARGNVDGFIDALPWRDFNDHLTDAAVPALVEPAGKAALLEAKAIKSQLSLNHVDELSRRYAQQQAGKLIVDITATQQQTIRNILGQAISGHYTKDQAARQIRQGIGLHPRWATAVQNFESKQRAQKRPTGYSPERWNATITKRTQTYYDRLLRKRSDIIARTEIITAENLGRFATWSDSIARGVNGPDSLKEWAPGPNACEICSGLAGQQVRWDKAFSNGSLMPPAHPGCRCVANLLPAPYKNPALQPRKINWTDPLGNRFEIDTDKYEDGYKLLDTPPTPKPKPKPKAKTTASTEQLATDTLKPLTDAQRAAINDYADADYVPINGALRTGLDVKDVQAQIDDIDAAIKAQEPLRGDITVYRGTHVSKAEDTNWVGRVITDQGYTSTTLSQQATDYFAAAYNQQAVRIELKVPQGTRGISIDGHKFGQVITDSATGESEFLLPRGSAYRITGSRMEDWYDAQGVKMVNQIRVLTAELEAPATEKLAAKTIATKADDFTLDTTLHWSDEKLMAQIGKYAETDPEVVDRIFEIIDQRAALQKATELRDLENAKAWADDLQRMQAKQRLTDLQTNQGKAPGAYPKNTDPVTNPAARKERKLNSRQINEEEYQQYLGAQMQRAEEELSVLLNNANLQEARQKGVDLYQLFTGPYHVAQKYASEELKDWWLANGRETLGSWRYKAFHRPTDKVHADRVRSLGHESGQARNAREYGL